MIVLPMVGKGSRFRSAGYTMPKFALPLDNGRTAFRAALDSFERYFNDQLFVFVIRDFDGFDTKGFLDQEVGRVGIKRFEIVKLKGMTSGQGETVREGLEILGVEHHSDVLTIFNIDSQRIGFSYPPYFKDSPYLEVFEGDGNQWSFAEIDEVDNALVRTTEKVRISNYCSNGLYHFNSCREFIKIYDEYKNEIKKEYGETYIAPIYNYFRARNIKCYVRKIPQDKMAFFGTPEQYIASKSV